MTIGGTGIQQLLDGGIDLRTGVAGISRNYLRFIQVYERGAAASEKSDPPPP